jgi:probable rRNA maturation factor
MRRIVTIRNRQPARAVDLPLLRRIVHALLAGLPQIKHADLGIFLVASPEMTQINETYLHHAGSTDVIAFDYANHGPRTADHVLHGEMFICVDEAIRQARRFRTTWQSELVRYLVHGVLHLCGHDDRHTADRRQMKHEEGRLLRSLVKRFPIGGLAARSARAAH